MLIHLLSSSFGTLTSLSVLSLARACCLQVLAHTIAHEMVHALVYNLFPTIDASSEAYLPDERHGPIFKLLNKHLFGHTIDSFRQVFKIG